MANKNPNTKGLKPFKKGYDPRRNLKGKPASFDQLRKLAQQLANSKLEEGSNVTIIQDILLQMTQDKRLMKDFLEFAYGKVPLSQIIKVDDTKQITWKEFIDGYGQDKDPKPKSGNNKS